MIGRRSFIAGILGAAAAPAIVKAESLMKIIVPRQRLYTGEIGIIDAGFRFTETPPAWDSAELSKWLNEGQRIVALNREMLRRAEPMLKLQRFAESRPTPAPTGDTLRFRRYGGTFLHPSPLHDLINTRKTA